MVFCGIYPADGAKYPDLRDALEKLQLNDAALQYEPETSGCIRFRFSLWILRPFTFRDYSGTIRKRI